MSMVLQVTMSPQHAKLITLALLAFAHDVRESLAVTGEVALPEDRQSLTAAAEDADTLRRELESIIATMPDSCPSCGAPDTPRSH